MSYNKIFNPKDRVVRQEEAETQEFGDLGGGHLFEEETILAINLAMVTGRTLLVKGPAGCGKSSMARAVAQELNRSYYPYVITSRSEARDLMWRYDPIRRLAEADSKSNDLPPSTNQFNNDVRRYITPGVLWWGFDPEKVRNYGQFGGKEHHPPGGSIPRYQKDGTLVPGCVVLLDEIDKADPDLPNSLLVPLGMLEFTIDEVGDKIEIPKKEDETWQDAVMRRPLIVVTTNEERELPEPFLRRCIITELKQPKTSKELMDIAWLHFSKNDPNIQEIVQNITNKMVAFMDKQSKGRAHSEISRSLPSTAEYLDAIRATIRLCQDEATCLDNIWGGIEKSLMLKGFKQ